MSLKESLTLSLYTRRFHSSSSLLRLMHQTTRSYNRHSEIATTSCQKTSRHTANMTWPQIMSRLATICFTQTISSRTTPSSKSTKRISWPQRTSQLLLKPRRTVVRYWHATWVFHSLRLKPIWRRPRLGRPSTTRFEVSVPYSPLPSGLLSWALAKCRVSAWSTR